MENVLATLTLTWRLNKDVSISARQNKGMKERRSQSEKTMRNNGKFKTYRGCDSRRWMKSKLFETEDSSKYVSMIK